MKMQLIIESLETRRLFSTNILADFGGIYPTQSVSLNGVSYFAANDGVHGSELWRSDGTIAGTSMVKDIQPGKGGSTPTGLNIVNGHVLFFAVVNTAWYLFSTDGTSVGTTALAWADNAGVGVSLQSQFEVINDRLVFSPLYAGYDANIWVSDGTAQGTGLLKQFVNILAGAEGNVDSAYTIGDDAIFSLRGKLIATDGTAPDTMQITPDSGEYFASNLSQVQDKLYYLLTYRDDLSRPVELWATDGTSAGTTLVDTLPGGMDYFASEVVAAGNKVYFEQSTDEFKTEDHIYLWSSDGTAAGTARVGLANNGVFPDHAVALNGQLIMFASGDDMGDLPMIQSTDGAANTPMTFVADVPMVTEDFTVIDGTIFFFVDPGAGGDWQLWRTDGTAQGTAKIQDLSPWSADNGYNVFSLANVNNQLVVTTDTQTFTYDPATMAAPIGSAINTRTLSNGILRIFGTANDDSIRIYDVTGDPTRFIVDLNGNKHSFAYSDVSRIYVYGYAGNDNIAVNEKAGAFTIRTEVWAGDGNDTVYTAEGRDTIYGDAGDDAMFGGNNNDMLSGGAGDDSIIAGNGDDTVTGGDGADSIQGNKGNDILSGGSDDSHDTINGGAGDNVLFGQAVYDTFFSNKPDAGIPVDDVLES